MNNTTLQIKFKQRLNKLASNDYDNIECWQIVEAFNKAQIEWVRRQLHGNNIFKEGDEQSKTSIDDLQELLQTAELQGIESDNIYISNSLPNNYLSFKRVSTSAKTECCPPRDMTTYLVEEANIDLILRDPLKRPDYDWGETICTLSGGRVKIFSNSDFKVYKPKLTYYRTPTNIQITGCKDPYTGLESNTDVPCEFKDDIAEILIDEAVAIIAGDITDVSTYQREMAAGQRNT
jgi:hypothetical protein